MQIGIIGLGMVGNAVKEGMQRIGHSVYCHDPKLNTSIKDVLATEMCFICVPTPSKDTGQCDVSIVETVVAELMSNRYKGILIIKSTVEPGTTKRLQNQYDTHRICFVPEFLRERFAVRDFIDNHDVCIIGTDSDEIYKKIVACHGELPKKFCKLSPTEAEMSKYMNNIYNATLIVLANSFYEVCQSLKVDYTRMKNAITNRNHICDMYLDCNPSLRGFGGPCLPKDLKAMACFVEKNHINVSFFKDILKENDKYDVTCYEGMRHA